MAVTIQQAPNPIVSGFNEILFVVSSNNTGQSNFQYVCDIYLTDDTGALTHNGVSYIRTKTPIDPLYSSGVFSIGKTIQSFLSYDVGTDEYGFQKSPNSVVKVICKFGEEYGPSSGITVYSDLATANAIYAINSSIGDNEWNITNIEDTFGIANTNSTTIRALTNRPARGIIRANENAWLSYTHEQANNSSLYGVIKTYDNAGALVQTYAVSNDYATITTSVGRTVLRFPSGTYQLSNMPSSKIHSGHSSINLNGVSSYEIYMARATSGQTSESQYYVIDDTCTDHTVYRLHFLNKWGGFDSFSFIKAHTERTEVSREKFKRNKITRIGGGRYGFNNRDLSDVQFVTKHKDTIRVISDWISEADSEWLEELCTSPVVFHDDPTYGLLPVTIVETSYDRKLWVTDKLFNLEISFQYSEDKYRQTL